MRQEKFYHFVGIGNLDNDNKRTLVYSPKDRKLYIASTEWKLEKKSQASLTSLGLVITTVLYTSLRDKTTSGLTLFLLSLGIGLLFGYLVARILLSVPITIEDFDRSTLDLAPFLLEQKKLIKKIWGAMYILIGLTLISVTIYFFVQTSLSIVQSSILAFTLLLLYFTGLHRRGRIIDRLLIEEEGR